MEAGWREINREDEGYEESVHDNNPRKPPYYQHEDLRVTKSRPCKVASANAEPGVPASAFGSVVPVADSLEARGGEAVDDDG